MLAGFTFGLGLAAGQLFAFTRRVVVSAWIGLAWMVLSVVGVNAWFFIMLAKWKGILYMASAENIPTTVTNFAVGGVIVGLLQAAALVGLLQGAALRRLLFGVVWTIANALGWGAGGYYGFTIGHQSVSMLMPNWGYTGILIGPGEMLHTFVTGCVIAATVGIATCLPATWLLWGRCKV
jgi:hypothetical protein